MKKAKAIIMSLILILVMAMPAIAIASPMDEVPQRTENGVVFVPLRLTAYAHGATVEWDGANRAVNITDISGDTWTVVVDAVGGFIQNGTTWVPYEFAARMFGATPVVEAAPEDLALGFINLLISGDSLGAFMMATAELQQVLELPMLHFIMRGNVIDFSLSGESYETGFHIFDITVIHETGAAIYRISINNNGVVAGFFLIEWNFEPMPAPENATYTDEAIVLGAGTRWPLDGILTMPQNASADNPVPAVILVHGSGANNMDTSIFGNRVFFDIADYLSSNGIAVLRYNKRTFTHSGVSHAYGDNFTIWQETIEDAILAAELLRADERIGDIFVAGHSLGGMLAPRIAEEAGLDGIIILAASPRALYEVSYHQNVQDIDIALELGVISQEEADIHLAMAAMLLEEARSLLQLSAEELQGEMVFGFPGVWQLSVLESLPLPFISRNDTPVLILHGTRDWQTPAEPCFQMFIDYTRDMGHVTAILYDNINHLLMYSQTPYNDLRDYMVPGNVYEQLLRDILDWVITNL